MKTEEVRAVEVWVNCRHEDFDTQCKLAGRGRFYADPLTVSRLARRYATRLFHNRIVDGKIRKITFAQCAGLLVYSMEGYGCNFEDVARRSDLGVAELVATASADPRETRAKRNLMLRSQLAHGRLLAQIVKLAELEATAQHVYETFTRDDYRNDPVAVKDWVTDTEELLRAMYKLLNRKRFRKPYARLHALLARIDHTLERAKRRLPDLPHVRLDAPAGHRATSEAGSLGMPSCIPAPCFSVPA